MQHWFPIKTNQPEIKFTVRFALEGDYEMFQDYVRKSQVSALFDQKQPWVTLWWPERNIDNWTGFIKEFEVGAQRFSPAPEALLTVELAESMVSKKVAAVVAGRELLDADRLDGEIPWVHQILKPPTPPVDTRRRSRPPTRCRRCPVRATAAAGAAAARAGVVSGDGT